MRTLPTMILLVPLALIGCSERRPDPRGVEPHETLLQISATGRTETAPNEARFTAGVQTIAASAGAASTGNNETINRVLAALDRLGIKKEEVQTRSVTLGRIGYGANRGKFEANNMIEVRVRNLDRAGEAIAATTDAGANVLSGPNLTVGDPEQAIRAAYAEAYKAARARADTYAEAAGLKVARVIAIRDTGEDPRPRYGYDMNMGATAEAAAPPPVEQTTIRPGMNASEVRVRADFALAPK
jgi:uncharacterized protein YggE